MKHNFFCFLFLCLSSLTLSSQAQCGNIDHWEMPVSENNIWRYQIPSTTIPAWNSSSFNDAAWTFGPGGMGYADGDDNTLITQGAQTIYMRHTFSIVDTAQIEQLILAMDYDDGFAAYLNGVEIARNGLNPNPAWNDFSSIDHEALLYQNLLPEYFTIPQGILLNGNNVLAVEVHNFSAASSDLSSRPFLLAGIDNPAQNYSPTPVWFQPPATLVSNLPLMWIHTNGQSIVDDPRITCDMDLIDNGPGNMNCLLDAPNAYQGKITIEVRGSTSQSFPKVPYGFSTVDATGNDLDVSLLGYPEEHDWILLNPYNDKTFMRDVLIYDIARSLNWYASRTRFIELVIDKDYKGIYVLLEKVKRDDGRVDIAKMSSTMNSGDSLSGGYIFKIDKLTGNSGLGWYTSNYNVFLQNHVPDWNQITPQQQSYLQGYVDSFEASLLSPFFTHPDSGYRHFANVYSFADYFILHEVSNNVDGYRLSTFIHKDRDSRCGRFTMGPLWDFNLSFGNANYCNGYEYQGWQMYQGCGDGSSYWINKMLQDSWFKNLLSCRYQQLRQGALSTNSLLARVDAYALQLKDAAVRDSTRWQTIGNWIWPNGWVASSWQGELDSMKVWMTHRMNWIDQNMFPSTTGCGNVAPLTLVPDEINFHSEESIDGGDWFELYNYGSTPIDVSHATFLDGDDLKKYCVLPANTILQAGQRLVICSDTAAFHAKYPGVQNYYGPLCFKLSNAGQRLVMLDKDNRQIFSVNFSDAWQCSTDGYGRSLQLLTPSSPLNLASSWRAGCVGGSPGAPFTPCAENPIYSEINYASSATQDAGDWVELFNQGTQSISLSNWILKDGSDQNQFVFPSGTTLNSGQYLVAFSDALKFSAQFPGLSNQVGPLGFGFQANQDVVRLYDANGKIQYSVCYSGNAPWPLQANAGGKTLENASYNGNANEASNWFAGCPEGSPGKVYDPTCAAVGLNPLVAEEQITLVPNPTYGVVEIYSSSIPDDVIVYSVSGQMLIQRKHVNRLDLSNLSEGIYFIFLRWGDNHLIRKVFKE